MWLWHSRQNLLHRLLQYLSRPCLHLPRSHPYRLLWRQKLTSPLDLLFYLRQDQRQTEYRIVSLEMELIMIQGQRLQPRVWIRPQSHLLLSTPQFLILQS